MQVRQPAVSQDLEDEAVMTLLFRNQISSPVALFFSQADQVAAADCL